MIRSCRRIAAGATLLVLVLVLGAGVAMAQVQPSEEFDELSPAGWELTPEAEIGGGLLVIGPNQAAFRPEPWGSGTLALRLRYQGAGIALISFGGGPNGATHLVIDDEGRFVLQTDHDGTVTQVATSDGAILAEEVWASIEIGAADGGATIALDGSIVVSASSGVGSPADGGIAIEAGGERTVSIDWIGGGAGTAEPASPSDPPEADPAPSTDTATTIAATDGTGLGSVLDDFFAINAANVDVAEFAINLALAGLLSFILSRVYIHWGTALSNRRRFATNFMLIAVTTTFIILVVRSSVALSLGLVGALSIVRFRAAIKDPEELAYMFLAIGIGIGLGDNQRLITIIALAAAVVIIMLVKVFHRRQEDFNLHVTVGSDGDLDLAAVTATLAPHCAAMRLSRYDEGPGRTEVVFLAEFETSGNLMDMRTSLREVAPEASVSFLDDKGTW